MAQVLLQNVSKVFTGTRKQTIQAVKSFDLTVRDGESVVLLGPSGAGKTTVLRLIAGLEEVTSGTISIDGAIMNKVAPEERDVAMVFQSFALYPHMTVGENLAFPLKLRRSPKVEIAQRVKEAAQMLGLGALLNRKPATLSGGERQRVALGRAIVRKPKVFLMDEPLSNLDVPMRAQMRAEIARLHQRLSSTIIYVTHDQLEAMTLADRIVVMKGGTIQQIGGPLDLYSQPANLFVAGFIGSPAMNFIHGTIIEEEQYLAFTTAGNPQLKLQLTKEQQHTLRALVNRPVVLGLRAGDLAISEPSESENTFTATVELVEPTGAETLIHLKVGATALVLRASGIRTAPLGAKLQVMCCIQKAHFFDAATQERIAVNKSL